MRPSARRVALWGLLSACGPAANDATSRDAIGGGNVGQSSPDLGETCLVANQSVLARMEADTMERPLRGWIRLGRTRSDSGSARLVDSDGYSLEATYLRLADSVVVSGFNDFVRIEFRMLVRDSAARGTYRAHSDAALERDSTGALGEFRRSGDIVLRVASCDSLPRTRGVAASPAARGGRSVRTAA